MEEGRTQSPLNTDDESTANINANGITTNSAKPSNDSNEENGATTVEELRKQLEQANKGKQRLWNNLLILKEKIIDTSKLIELYRQEQEARQRLERARKEDLVYKHQHEIEKRNVESLHLQIDTLLKELSPLRERLDKALEENEEAQKALEKKESELKATKAYNVQLQAEIEQGEEWKEAEKTLKKEVRKLKKELARKTQECGESTRENIRLRGRLNDFDKENEVLKKKIAVLRVEISLHGGNAEADADILLPSQETEAREEPTKEKGKQQRAKPKKTKKKDKEKEKEKELEDELALAMEMEMELEKEMSAIDIVNIVNDDTAADEDSEPESNNTETEPKRKRTEDVHNKSDEEETTITKKRRVEEEERKDEETKEEEKKEKEAEEEEKPTQEEKKIEEEKESDVNREQQTQIEQSITPPKGRGRGRVRGRGKAEEKETGKGRGRGRGRSAKAPEPSEEEEENKEKEEKGKEASPSKAEETQESEEKESPRGRGRGKGRGRGRGKSVAATTTENGEAGGGNTSPVITRSKSKESVAPRSLTSRRRSARLLEKANSKTDLQEPAKEHEKNEEEKEKEEEISLEKEVEAEMIANTTSEIEQPKQVEQEEQNSKEQESEVTLEKEQQQPPSPITSSGGIQLVVSGEDLETKPATPSRKRKWPKDGGDAAKAGGGSEAQLAGMLKKSRQQVELMLQMEHSGIISPLPPHPHYAGVASLTPLDDEGLSPVTPLDELLALDHSDGMDEMSADDNVSEKEEEEEEEKEREDKEEKKIEETEKITMETDDTRTEEERFQQEIRSRIEEQQEREKREREMRERMERERIEREKKRMEEAERERKEKEKREREQREKKRLEEYEAREAERKKKEMEETELEMRRKELAEKREQERKKKEMEQQLQPTQTSTPIEVAPITEKPKTPVSAAKTTRSTKESKTKTLLQQRKAKALGVSVSQLKKSSASRTSAATPQPATPTPPSTQQPPSSVSSERQRHPQEAQLQYVKRRLHVLKSKTLLEIAEDFLQESNVDEGVLLVALEGAFRERGRKDKEKQKKKSSTKEKTKKKKVRLHLANRKEERLVYLVWKIHELKEKQQQAQASEEKFLNTLLRHIMKTILEGLDKSDKEGGGGVLGRVENECLCRAFTALSILNGESARVRVLCCDMITVCGERPATYDAVLSLVGNMLSVWGDVLKAPRDEDKDDKQEREKKANEEESEKDEKTKEREEKEKGIQVKGGRLLIETIKGILFEMFAVAIGQASSSDNDRGAAIQENFEEILAHTGWPSLEEHRSTLGEFPTRLIEQLLEVFQSCQPSKGYPTLLFPTIKSMELIAQFQEWAWTYNNLIVGILWPLLAPDNSAAWVAIRLIGWLCKAVITKLRGLKVRQQHAIQIEGLDWLRSSLMQIISGDLDFPFTAKKSAVEALFDMSTENQPQPIGGKATPPASLLAGMPDVKKWMVSLTPKQRKHFPSHIRADFQRLL